MKILAIVLVGGKRTELGPLVEQRCKAAVPIFGKYRIIDFPLSNLINSGIRQVMVMVQYMYDSLQKHIRDGWNFLSPEIGEYIDVYPPQQREGERWYQGTADAIYQNLFSIEAANPDHILVIHGDHIAQVNYRNIINHHIENDADMTVTTISQKPEMASKFGNIVADEKTGNLKEFYEKPKEPKGQKNAKGNVYINAGVYIFKANELIKALRKDERNKESEHNISKNIIPQMLKDKKKLNTYYYKGKDDNPYNWHFFLNLDNYYDTNMRILDIDNKDIDLDNPEWPIKTNKTQNPPSFIAFTKKTEADLNNSSIGSGVEVFGTVKNSIIGNNVIVEEGAVVEDSIIFNNTKIEKGAKVKNAILDKKVLVQAGHTLGYNIETDKNMFYVTEKGRVVISKGKTV